MSTLPQIRYFATGWYYTDAEDNNEADMARGLVNPNTAEALRIILDINTPSGTINGGGGNDEFYVDFRVVDFFRDKGPKSITINDPTGTNTVIFAEDTSVLSFDEETRYDHRIRLKHIALHEDDPNTADITVSVTQVTYGTRQSGPLEGEFVFNSTRVKDVTFTVSNVIADPITGAVTKFQFKSGNSAGIGEQRDGIVTLQELMDHAIPAFAKTSYAAEILRDDVSATTPIITVSGTDGDRGILPLSHLIVGGNDNGYFNIRGTTGAIVFNPNKVDALKSDPARQHTLTVRAHDGALFSDVEVVITLTLESIRYFPSDSSGAAGWYYTQGTDNTIRDTATTLTKADAERIIIDANTPAGISNEVNGGGGNDVYYIEHNIVTGIEINDTLGINTIMFAADKTEAGTTTSISVKSVEAIPQQPRDVAVTLTITTDDGTTPATRDVRLIVHNVEPDPVNGGVARFAFEGGDLAGRVFTADQLRDYASGIPTFTQASYSVEIPEDRNVASDASVIAVSAVDSDLASGSSLTYSIIRAVNNIGNAVSIFNIDSTSGAITFKANAALDRETTSHYTLTVRASDGTKHSDVLVTIDVGDVDEHPHSFNFLNTIFSTTFDEQTIHPDGGPRGTDLRFTMRDADNKVYTADDFAVHRVRFFDDGYADVGVDERFDIVPIGLDNNGNIIWHLVVLPGTTLDDTTEPVIQLSIVAYDDGEAIRTSLASGVDDAVSIIVRGIGLPSEGKSAEAEFGFKIEGEGLRLDRPRVEETLTVYVTQNDDDENGTLTTDDDGNITGGATFQWYYTKDGVTTKIDGATSVSYTLGEETLGAKISVDVEYTDGDDNEEYVRTTHDYVVQPANKAPTFTFTGTPSIIEGNATDHDLFVSFDSQADDPDGNNSGLRYSLVNPPSGWLIWPTPARIAFRDSVLDYERTRPDPTNGNKRGQELTVRVTDENGKGKSTDITIFVEVINREEGPATLNLDLPQGENAGTLEGGEVLMVSLNQNDPDGFAHDTTYVYKWYRAVDGVEATNPLHTGDTYTIDATNDLSTDTKRVDIIVRATYTDGFGKEEVVTRNINYVGRDVDAEIAFSPSVARATLTDADSIGLNIITQDPNGYTIGAPLVYEWYRVVDGVEEATPIQSTSATIKSATTLGGEAGVISRRDLEAQDISTAGKRVDVIFRISYTDGFGRQVTVEERLNHIGITEPVANEAPAFDTSTTSFIIDEGVHDNSLLHRVSATDPEKDSLTFSLTDAAPAGYSIVNNGDNTADIYFTGTIAEGAADGTLTVQAQDPNGNTKTLDLTFQVNELPEITVTGRANIPENTDYTTTPFQISGAAGAPVTITASDGDSDPLTYDLADGTLAGFTIDQNTGAITYSGGALNFEEYLSTNGVITLVVEVSDGRSAKPATQEVEVQITDVQEGSAEIELNTNAPFVGEPLWAVVTRNDPEGNGNLGDADAVSHQWYSKTGDDAPVPISGANEATYIVPEGSAGKIFSVEITYEDGSGFSDTATATTTKGAEEGTLTLNSRFVDNGNPVPFQLDVDDAWTATKNRLPKYVFASYTGDPTLTVTYINKAGIERISPIIKSDGTEFSERDVPPYWLGFDLIYDGAEISLDFNSLYASSYFDTGGDSDDSTKGSADSLLPTGILQDFTITATYGAVAKTVDFQLRLVDDDDHIDARTPFVTQSGGAYRANLLADEAALEADSTDPLYDDGARSGTFYINDIDEGDTYVLQASIGSVAVTVNVSGTESITTAQGTFTITLDGKQIDWTYAYNSADLGNGATLTDRVQIVVTDTLENDVPLTRTATPLTFALQTRPEGPVFTQSQYAFDVPEGVTDVGLIAVSSEFATTYSIIAGNDKNLFVIDRNNGAITLARTLDFERDDPQYTLTIQGSDRNGALTTEVIVDLINVDESQSTYTITGASADSTDTDLANLIGGWTLSVALDTADAEGVKASVAPVYRWFYASDPDGNIGTDSTSYTVKAADAGEVIGVGVTYTDNNDVSFEAITMLDADNEVGFVIPSPDQDNTITIPGTHGMEVDAGDGSDTIIGSAGDDTITGGLGDDDIELGTGDDQDVVIYTIGDQTAKDGDDGITNFQRGKDKFVFALESNTETSAITDMDGFLDFVTKGTASVNDDEFMVHLEFDLSGNAPSLDGVNFLFMDSTFFSGGRISMPIVGIDFAQSIVGTNNIISIFGDIDTVQASLSASDSILIDLSYLNTLLGGDDTFEAVGFQLIDVV